MNREGTKRCPVLYGSEILIILGVVYCWEKNNEYVVVCKNHVNMCLCDVLTWKL